jgi:hypothetical protein
LDDDTFSVSKNLEKSHRKVRLVLYRHYHFTCGAGGKENKPLPLFLWTFAPPQLGGTEDQRRVSSQGVVVVYLLSTFQ